MAPIPLPLGGPMALPLGGPIPLPFIDPTAMLQVVSSLISEWLKQTAASFDWVLEYYFLWTGNFHGGGDCLLKWARPECSFTGNDVLRGLYLLMAVIANSLMAAIVTYSFLRSIFERSFRARYTLKAILPRALLVIVMVNFGLALMQGAIDLNNGMVHAIWTYRPGLDPTASNLWQLLIAPPPYNLLLAVLFMLVGILLIVLAITSVARNLLLLLLIVGAPMAFICLLLPELRSFANEWKRLFLTSVFTQAAQVLVLKVSLILVFQDHGLLQAIHGLVAMYLVLKVPGALHAGSKAESKLMMWARHGEHVVERGFEHATGSHTTRTRAHPAAD